MRNKKLLFLLQEFPYPPVNGIKIKTWNVLSFISQFYDCDIMCFGNKKDENLSRDFFIQNHKIRLIKLFYENRGLILKIRQLIFLLKLLPPSFGRYCRKDFRKILSSLLKNENYDLIIFDLPNMIQYINIERKKRNGKKILSVNDALSLTYLELSKIEINPFKKFAFFLKYLFFRRIERKYYKLFDLVHIVSKDDLYYLKLVAPDVKWKVINISLTEDFPMNSILYKKLDSCDTKIGHRILITGNMTGNKDLVYSISNFINKCFPTILKKIPETKLIILGKGIPQHLLRTINDNKNIYYYQCVKNYYELLNNVTIVIFLDNTGRGMKNRVLQTLALGKLVIGTKQSFLGIEVKNDKHCYIFNSFFELTEIIINMLNDPIKRKEIMKNASELILKNYTFEMTGKKWKNTIDELTGQK